MVTCLHKFEEDIVISGSADRQIKVWKIEETFTTATVSSKGKKKGKSITGTKTVEVTESAGLNRIFELSNGRKVNAISSSSLVRSHVAVADTSSSIVLYSVTR